MGGCACGIIEASLENERSAAIYSRQAREYRADAERRIAQAERMEEKARRFNGGGAECESCDGVGAHDFMGDGMTEWEICDKCEGFGVTRALKCGDHSDISEEDLRDDHGHIFLGLTNPYMDAWPFFSPGVFQHWGMGLHVTMNAEKLRAFRESMPGTSDAWVGRRWAATVVW